VRGQVEKKQSLSKRLAFMASLAHTGKVQNIQHFADKLSEAAEDAAKLEEAASILPL
jgi:hypothetical protein